MIRFVFNFIENFILIQRCYFDASNGCMGFENLYSNDFIDSHNGSNVVWFCLL